MNRPPPLNTLFPNTTLFRSGGAVPLLVLCIQAVRHPNRRTVAAETETAEALYVPAPE